MQTSEKGIVALIGHEGIVPGPYLDSVKVWTYGVGHTKGAGDPDPAKMARGMPADLDAELVRVFEIFRRDLTRYEDAVRTAIRIPVAQHEFDAAVSFHYNTGAIARATWVKSLNAGDRNRAAAEMMNWRKPPEIIGRREDEMRLFRDGTYPDKRLTVWQVSATGAVIWKPARTLLPSEAMALMRGSVRPDVEPPAPVAREIPTTTNPLVILWRHFAGLFAR